MKLATNSRFVRSVLFPVVGLFVAVGLLEDAAAHGMGHSHSARESMASVAPVQSDSGADSDGSDPLIVEGEAAHGHRWWAASLSTFFESKHIHYGVTEAEGSPVYGTEVGAEIENFSLTVSGIFALENDWKEWNFTTAYSMQLGPLFVTPGFNFRWSPSGHSHGENHGDHESHGNKTDAHHHDEAADHGHHDHDSHNGHGDHSDHSHNKTGYELFLVVGTDVIPYVQPSVGFLWDLAEGSGGFMEIRLDGEIPLYKRTVTLNPYTSLGLNFGYNTHDSYGWNNFLYGANLNVALTKNITVYGGVGQNVAMQGAKDAGSNSDVFATAGVSFSF